MQEIMVDGGIPIMAKGHVFFGSRHSLVPCTTYSFYFSEHVKYWDIDIDIDIGEDVLYWCLNSVYDVKSVSQPDTMSLFANNYLFQMTGTGFAELF
jgi:hypothetical protein